MLMQQSCSIDVQIPTYINFSLQKVSYLVQEGMCVVFSSGIAAKGLLRTSEGKGKEPVSGWGGGILWKGKSLLNTIMSSCLLFGSVAVYSSDRNNSTDMIYGTYVTVPSQSEPLLTRPTMTNDLATDLLYGEYQPQSSPSEPHDLFTDNDNNSTDLIYGS